MVLRGRWAAPGKLWAGFLVHLYRYILFRYLVKPATNAAEFFSYYFLSRVSYLLNASAHNMRHLRQSSLAPSLPAPHHCGSVYCDL